MMAQHGNRRNAFSLIQFFPANANKFQHRYGGFRYQLCQPWFPHSNLLDSPDSSLAAFKLQFLNMFRNHLESLGILQFPLSTSQWLVSFHLITSSTLERGSLDKRLFVFVIRALSLFIEEHLLKSLHWGSAKHPLTLYSDSIDTLSRLHWNSIKTPKPRHVISRLIISH